MASFNGRPTACDARILPIKFNALGTPERPLADVVSESVELEMGWPLVGLRTPRWCLNYLTVEGLGFEAHHETSRFRKLCKLDGAAWGVEEHFQMSMILRQLIQVDQIDGCNSMGDELMFRRVQTIEYAHSEKARELESKKGWWETVVGGATHLRELGPAGTLMIAPALLDHVKIQVEKGVQLQKNEEGLRGRRGRRGMTGPAPLSDPNSG